MHMCIHVLCVLLSVTRLASSFADWQTVYMQVFYCSSNVNLSFFSCVCFQFLIAAYQQLWEMFCQIWERTYKLQITKTSLVQTSRRDLCKLETNCCAKLDRNPVTTCMYIYRVQRSSGPIATCSPGLADFVVGLVEFILHLPNEQVKVFWEVLLWN